MSATRGYSWLSTRPGRLHRNIWIGALATFGVGDVVTTLVFLSLGSNFEGNPIAAGAIGEFGLLALIPLKVAALAVFYALYRLAPSEVSVGVPVGLALLGSIITVWNIYSSVAGVRIYF